MRSYWYIAALLMGVGFSCSAYALSANPWASENKQASQSASGASQKNLLPANPWVGKQVRPVTPSQKDDSGWFGSNNKNVSAAEDEVAVSQDDDADEKPNNYEEYEKKIKELSNVYGKKMSASYEDVSDTANIYGKKVKAGYDNVVDTTQSYGRKIKDGYNDAVDTAKDYGRKIKRGYNSAVDLVHDYGRKLRNSFKVLGNTAASLKGSLPH